MQGVLRTSGCVLLGYSIWPSARRKSLTGLTEMSEVVMWNVQET